MSSTTAAKRLGVDRRTVSNWAKRGVAPAERKHAGGQLRVDEKWVEQREREKAEAEAKARALREKVQPIRRDKPST